MHAQPLGDRSLRKADRKSPRSLGICRQVGDIGVYAGAKYKYKDISMLGEAIMSGFV